MTRCHIANSRWYIKTDGSIYPCCMAGGELGQTLETSLYIGNILTESVETLSDVATIPLRNLDNPICDSCTPKYFKSMPEEFRK